MLLKWFVYKNEVVLGPLSAEEIQSRLEQNDLAGGDLVFGKGMKSWDKLAWWLKELPRLSTYMPEPLPDIKLSERAPSPADAPTKFVPLQAVANASNEATVMVKVGGDAPTVQLAVAHAPSAHLAHAPTVAWHFALGGKSLGPFDHSALIEQLKTAEPLHEVMLWTKGMKEWAPIFEFHDILSDLQANKRAFPRADIDGKVVLKVAGASLTAQLLTISEGGLSVRLDRGVRSGQTAELEIQSRAFGQPLRAVADIRFAVSGIVGLRFSEVGDEAKALIADYVRQASNTKFDTRAA